MDPAMLAKYLLPYLRRKELSNSSNSVQDNCNVPVGSLPMRITSERTRTSSHAHSVGQTLRRMVS